MERQEKQKEERERDRREKQTGAAQVHFFSLFSVSYFFLLRRARVMQVRERERDGDIAASLTKKREGGDFYDLSFYLLIHFFILFLFCFNLG